MSLESILEALPSRIGNTSCNSTSKYVYQHKIKDHFTAIGFLRESIKLLSVEDEDTQMSYLEKISQLLQVAETGWFSDKISPNYCTENGVEDSVEYTGENTSRMVPEKHDSGEVLESVFSVPERNLKYQQLRSNNERDKNEVENESTLCKTEVLETIEIFIQYIILISSVPHLSDREEYNLYNKTDFKSMPRKARSGLIAIGSILENLIGSKNTESLHRLVKSLAPEIVVYAVSFLTRQDWSSEGCRNAAGSVIRNICMSCNCSNMSELLTDSDTRNYAGDLFKKILNILRPRLTKNTWKKHPSARVVFKHCLSSVKFPHLSAYLDTILPPSLIFTDDHNTENRILGIHCLTHIVDNTTKAELCWYGRADVVYEALNQKVYTRDPDVVAVLYPCLLKIMPLVDSNARNESRAHRPSKMSSLFGEMLQNMQMESTIALRQAYSKHLTAFVEYLGIATVKYFPKLFQVVFEYLETYEEESATSRIHTLVALETIIKETWPRIPQRCTAIIQNILKLVYDVTGSESTNPGARDIIIAKAESIVVLLRELCPELVRETLEGIKDLELWNTDCKTFITKLLSN